MSSTDSDQITDEALASSISDDGRLSSDAFDADEEGIVEAGIPPQALDFRELVSLAFWAVEKILKIMLTC